MTHNIDLEIATILNSGLSAEQTAELSDIALSVHQATTYGELFPLMVGFYEQIGAGAVFCAIFDNRDDSLVGFSSSMREAPLKEVADDDLLREDPLLHWIKHSTEPALLGYGFGVTPPWQQGRARLFFENLRDFGYHGLLFQPIKLASGPFSVGITVATELEPVDARAYLVTHSSLVLISAKMFGQRAAHLFQSRDLDDTWRPRRAMPLSKREHEVVTALSRGDRPEQIAFDLSIKPVTVHMHVASARQKLGARTREQLVSLALKQGLL